MRKPDLEPIIKAGSDSDTTPDIPDIPDVPADTAPAGGGPAIPDTPYNGPEVFSDLPDLPDIGETHGGPWPDSDLPEIPAASGGGDGGSGDLPRVPEEEETDLRKLAESIQEYLQELDPQQVSDTVQSALAELQQQDYSFLAGLPNADLTPQQADRLVHDLLTELQQVDYYALTENYLHRLTADQVEAALQDFINGFTYGLTGGGVLPGAEPGVLPESWFPSEPADHGPAVDQGFKEFGIAKDFWDIFHFKNLLPGKFAELVLKWLGIQDGYDQAVKKLLDLNGDGKESWLGAFIRNLTKFLIMEKIGNSLGKLYEKLLGMFGISPKSATVLSVPLKHIPNGLIQVRQGVQLLQENTRYLMQQQEDAQKRQAELAPIDRDESQALAAACEEEEKANEEARRAEARQIEEANRVEAEAKEENERIEREAKEENDRVEREAKEKADATYQEQESKNNAERDRITREAEAARDSECKSYREAYDKEMAQISKDEQAGNDQINQWAEGQHTEAANRCNQSMQEAYGRFQTGEGSMEARQSAFHTEKLAAQEQLAKDTQSIEAEAQSRREQLTSECNSRREAAEATLQSRTAESHSRCNETCARANGVCDEKNREADAARQEAYRSAEAQRSAADERAQTQRRTADKAATDKGSETRSGAEQACLQAQQENARVREGKCESIQKDAQAQRDAVNGRHDAIADKHREEHAGKQEEIRQAARQDTQKVNENFDKISHANDNSKDQTKGHTGLGQ